MGDAGDQLVALARKFIDDNKISCPEATVEDLVYENAPDLVAAMAEIVGYFVEAPSTCSPGGKRIPCGKCQPRTDRGQDVRCSHEAYQGQCVHCGVQISKGRALSTQSDGWRSISTAKKDGTWEWVGRGGDYPFADWMRWDGARWTFSDGSYMTNEYGPLLCHPLPAAPTSKGSGQ